MGAPIGNQNARKYTADDYELVQNLINEYFEDCNARELPYTMSGLSDALEIDRDTLINYGKEALFSALIKKAKNKIQRQLEENALMGKGNATFTIFNLKNNYGWKDQQEQVIEHNIDNITPLIDMLNASEDKEQENE